MSAPKNELDERLVRYLDGTLEAEEVSQLIAELTTNPAARAQLRGMAAHAVAIAEAGRCAEAQQTSSAPTTRLAPLPTARPGAQWCWRNVVRWAAVFLVAATGAGWWANTAGRPPSLEITQSRGVVNWSESDGESVSQPVTGQTFSSGTLDLIGNDSLVTVRAKDGTTLTLHGQSEAFFCYEGGWKVRLREGSFEAAVQPQPTGEPLRVLTPTAEIVVKGTKFSMQAQAQETRLEVAEGLVTMRRLADGRVASVGGQEQLVVTLDPKIELSPQRRVSPPAGWQANFGQYPATSDGAWMPPNAVFPSGALASQPFVAGRRDDGGVLVHHGVFIRSHGGLASVQNASELRLKVRMADPQSLQIMLVTTRAGGGFGGNYEVNVQPEEGELRGGWRELRVPLKTFQTKVPATSALPPGHIIDSILINSYTWSAGLEVAGLAISPP